jgi:hypothetical protein
VVYPQPTRTAHCLLKKKRKKKGREVGRSLFARIAFFVTVFFFFFFECPSGSRRSSSLLFLTNTRARLPRLYVHDDDDDDTTTTTTTTTATTGMFGIWVATGIAAAGVTDLGCAYGWAGPLCDWCARDGACQITDHGNPTLQVDSEHS